MHCIKTQLCISASHGVALSVQVAAGGGGQPGHVTAYTQGQI